MDFPRRFFHLQISPDLVQTSKIFEREIIAKRAGSEETSDPVQFNHVCERDFLLCSSTYSSRHYSEPSSVGYITISVALVLKS